MGKMHFELHGSWKNIETIHCLLLKRDNNARADRMSAQFTDFEVRGVLLSAMLLPAL
jgi:hypothetical protein